MAAIELAPHHKQGLSLRNPVMTACGCFGYGVEYGQLVEVARLGAVVTSPVSLRPRRGAVQPRLVETAAGFVLTTGDQNPGVRRVIERYAGAWARLGVPVVAHLAPDEPAAAARTALALASTGAVAGLELDVPASGSPAEASAAVRAALESELPLLVRLPLARAAELAAACAEWGADALVVGAPPPGAARHPSGALVSGSLYGPAVHALALAALLEVRRRVEVPLIGCGGVHTPDDGRAFLDAGAAAIQLDSVLFADPSAAARLAGAGVFQVGTCIS